MPTKRGGGVSSRKPAKTASRGGAKKPAPSGNKKSEVSFNGTVASTEALELMADVALAIGSMKGLTVTLDPVKATEFLRHVYPNISKEDLAERIGIYEDAIDQWNSSIRKSIPFMSP